MITFVGAGPGDPDLITLKGQKKLAQADVVVYAGSLVNPEILQHCREEATIYNSASMTLEEVLVVMIEAYKANKKVVRLHTGDPSIYGAIREQMDELDIQGIPYKVVPGVSSFLAASATLKREFTLPGLSQTVIITRQAGRTAVPEKESLRLLAQHGTSMCIFLSTHKIEEVVAELIQGGYDQNTPAAVVYKASWPEEAKVVGTLETIAKQVREAGFTKTSMILVGPFLEGPYERSMLYDPTFSHGFRKGTESRE
ncbi:precorrin-4 C(11)-methyltransferase [Heliorestis acidaminivorans]|uniref:Precorrin-4 C(11)-methyltransferase n=1 Tax=Heliorestis acidaminivorans TaxID=553427 RepID=A0A6I0F2G3_9FIRM|nr:precorrin-4 C(11)-methyltransferase [Heliorestis acidaminivorans]KAB2954181.1 precorrin-4 C(11)-methyltransferase [Heliorestis acidaminivorans]